MKREIVSPVLLTIVLAFWALDEARLPGHANEWPWVRPVIVTILFAQIAHRMWRGRYAAWTETDA